MNRAATGEHAGNGLLVSFEGIEKSGKDTQLELLVEFAKTLDVEFAYGREPGGTSYGEIERRCLQDPSFVERVNKGYAGITGIPQLSTGEELCHAAEMFGYFKARAQFFALKVHPIVKRGGVFVLGRSGDSTTAYQGFGLYNGEQSVVHLIRRNNAFAMQGLQIARTWLLDIPVEEMYRRKDHHEFGTAKDRIEQRDADYFERTRNGYLWLAKHEDRFMVIDGMQSKEQIAQQIKEDFLTLLSHR